MNGPILIVPLAGDVYEARSDRGLSSPGASPESALAQLRTETEHMLEERWKATTVPHDGGNPWSSWAGGWDPNDPVIQEWNRAVQEYRESVDRGPDGI